MPLHGRNKVDKAVINLVKVTNDNLYGVYLAGLANIIQETPVDTGVTRNNWFLSTGLPSSKNTNTASKSANSSTRQLSTMPDWVLNKKLFFTNNRNNIGVLEYGGYPNPVKNGSYIKGKYQKLSAGGFSKQAPSGWVRSTLIQMQNKIRSL